MLSLVGHDSEAASLDHRVRTIFVALLMGVLVALGAFAPVAAAAHVPKVAVIVGPVGSLTASYRALADDAAAVARQAGAQVVKVYSPNATWAAVKEALSGASIVIYLGHGNGWPSRYRDALFPPSQNGFGLNPVAGVDNSTHQYFGEASLDEVRLAKNAVVLLHHLCYASGNTEPGLSEGTLDQSIQRVDNYAAGFLRAGATAVVAEAHLGPAYYVRQLLKTRLSVEQIWARSPTANGHTLRSASERTPGYTERLDPDHASSGFYRSLVSRGATAKELRSGGTGTIGSASVIVPAVPSLTSLALHFGELSLATLPIAATKTTLSLPLASGNAAQIPAGAQVGLRWDPVLLDPELTPDPAPQTDPGASPSPDPSAPAAPSPSPAADPASHGLFTLPSAGTTPEPTATPASGQEPEASVIPTEAPAVDLVVPERLGTVVSLAAMKRGTNDLSVATTFPTAPGLYRLVPTLHTPSGEAYDSATQNLLTPVLVHVGGPVAVAYGAPASLTLPAQSIAMLPIRVVNAGSEAWDQFVTTAPGTSGGVKLPNGRLTHLPATLAATWVSATGQEVPKASFASLDPELSGPGTNIAVTLGIEAPATPGEYLLLIDVVSPAHGALSALGSAPAIIRVTVSAPLASPTPVPPQRH